MTLQFGPPLYLSQARAEFQLPANARFPTDFAGRGTLPGPGVLKRWSQLYGQSYVVFTPDGGTQQFFGGSGDLRCTVPAVWTYTGGGPGGSANIPSGGTANVLLFSVDDVKPGVGRALSWSVTGTASGITRNFDITVYSPDFS